jgi:hypothetical protein
MARFNLSEVSKDEVSRIASTRGAVARRKIFEGNYGTLVFAGLLIVCSVAVGCSSEKPKTESTTNQAPISQMTPPAAPVSTPTPPVQAEAKPVHKKVVHRAPATVAYADKTSGVAFQYPRKYVLKTGEGMNELVTSGAMDFVQPGGVAIAAVTVPEGAYPKSDLASAFFDVSVNKGLTEEQCGQFGGPQPATAVDATAQPVVRPTKLMIGDMELQSTGTLASVGSGKEESKYYHVFENGACYEFALKVATTGETDEGGKAVNRDEIFKRLEGILATVKINPVKSAEVTASVPTTETAPGTPAQ